MRYAKTTLIAAASSLGLLASLALPASATPSFTPASNPSAGGLTLVKSGGGGGGGGGGGHGVGNFAAIGGGHPGMGGGMGMRGVPHGNSFSHMGGGHNEHIARGGDFDGGRHGRMANNWNGNWNGNWHGDHHHHHGHFNRFYAYPFFYGGYYAYDYGYGGCGWLYRRALATNSPYWWNRYYACIY